MSNAINIDSEILQLQSLETQYKTKLDEYKRAYASYITTVQSESSDKNSYVVLPGKIFMGDGSISDNANSNISQCEALCSANSMCSGASFNAISNVCKLRKGMGLLSEGAVSDNAIITRIKQQLIQLDSINSQLIDINNKMREIRKNIQPSVNENSDTLYSNNLDLTNNNNSLLAEQNKIKRLLAEYNDVEQEYINQSLNADQKINSYYLWMTVMILSVFMVIKYTMFPESKGNIVGILLNSTFIIFLLFATIHMNNPAVYAIWICLVALVILIKADLMPFL
jgi:PAN domain